jgi:hypothetical protein
MPDLESIPVADGTVDAHVRVPDGATCGIVVLHAWWA